MNTLIKGEVFQPGEIWMSPKGVLHRVMAYEVNDGMTKKVVLRISVDGSGRKVIRDWDAISSWTLLSNEQVAVHWQLPFDLGTDWGVKALPDRSRVILLWNPLGTHCGSVTINETDRTFAFGMDTIDATMSPYDGPRWRQNLYSDAMNSLRNMLG